MTLPEQIILGVGVVALVVAWGAGCFRRRALGRSWRGAGLEPIDLPIGLMVMMLGWAAAGLLAPALGLVQSEEHKLSARETAAVWLLGQALMQLPVVVYFAWRAGRHPRGWRAFGLVPARPWRDLGAGVLGIVFALPVVSSVGLVGALVGEQFGFKVPQIGHEMLETLSQTDDRVVVTSLLLSAVVVAPVLEEMIFRGLVQSVLRSVFRPWPTVIAASVVFAAIHYSAVTWVALPALLALALTLGWLYERTGSLWPGILVHAGFNLVNVAQVVGGK
jgi:membrane protease YdiL (CAAX protease family)